MRMKLQLKSLSFIKTFNFPTLTERRFPFNWLSSCFIRSEIEAEALYRFLGGGTSPWDTTKDVIMKLEFWTFTTPAQTKWIFLYFFIQDRNFNIWVLYVDCAVCSLSKLSKKNRTILRTKVIKHLRWPHKWIRALAPFDETVCQAQLAKPG